MSIDVLLQSSEPGTPIKDAHLERLNARLRECLNEYVLFGSTMSAAKGRIQSGTSPNRTLAI
jgi:hypothetical protein